jgi:putative membrane protein
MKSIAFILVFGVAFALLLSSCDKNGDSTNVYSNNDVLFVKKAAASNFAEITLGQIAADSSTDSTIKQFGAQMVSEHSAAQQQLQAIAGTLGIDATATLDSEHQLLVQSLLTLKGRAFDSLYIHSQVGDHETTIDFFKQQSAHGLQRDVKQYVFQTLPELTLHLQAATTIASKY